MRRIGVVVALAALCSQWTLPSPASADLSDGRLVIRGDRTAFVEVTLVRPTSDSIGSRGYLNADFTTQGSYAAYVMKPVDADGPRAAGALLTPWAFTGERPRFSNHSDDRALPAGRYRLYLITDGATSFSVTLPGYGETIVAEPVTPFNATAEFRELGLGSAPPELQARQPFHRTAEMWGLSALLFDNMSGSGTVDMKWCVTRRDRSCEEPDAYMPPTSSSAYAPTINPEGSRMQWTYIIRPTFGGPPGEVDALWHAGGAYSAGRRSLFLLNADLNVDAISEKCGSKGHGYWMVDEAGAVYGFGSATWFGNAPVGRTPVSDIEATPARNGYWVLDRAGHVFAMGGATYLGGFKSLRPGEYATALAATPTGRGYWIFTSAGRAVPFGDASFHGDVGDLRLNGEVLDAIATPSGHGYYMVASDGGIFTFGNATFKGSMGATTLNAPVQSLVPDPDASGYWLVASDGGIFTFDTHFHGSMGNQRLNRPVTAMVGACNGYLMVAEDGGIFTFGNANFDGSLGSNPPASRVVSVANFQ